MPYSTEISKNLDVRYNEIPDDLADLIASNEIPDFIEELATKYNLEEVEAEAIENEITLVVMAYEQLGNFYENIRKATGFEDTRVGSIVDDVLSDLLIDVIPLIASINLQQQKLDFEEKDAENAPPTPNKEKLQLRPDSVTSAVTEGVRPVTKEELISSIATSRTMATDMARAKGEPAPKPEVQKGPNVTVGDSAPTIKKEVPPPPGPTKAPEPTADTANEPLPYAKPLAEPPAYKD